jgi:hypothetical protein
MNPGIAKNLGIDLSVIMPQLSEFDNRKAPLTTSDGKIIRSWDPVFREPLFKNDYVYGVRNSIEFQNAGETDVLINGNWTIKKGGSKVFESTDEVNINAKPFVVYFPSDPFNENGLNRLEICEIILCDLTVTFAKHKGIQYNG